jgi:N-hydroxyarylamine O-acetyltransferase
MMLRVEAPGEPRPYLADVGFGAAGSPAGAAPAGHRRRVRGRRPPVPADALPSEQPPDLLELRMYDGRTRDWVGQYAFTLEPFAAPD